MSACVWSAYVKEGGRQRDVVELWREIQSTLKKYEKG